MPAKRVGSSDMKHPVPVKFRHIQNAEQGGMDVSDYIDRLLGNIQALQTLLSKLSSRVRELEDAEKRRD